MLPKKIALTRQLKSDVRRAIGEDGGLNDRATDKVLLLLCRTFRGESEDTQSTMALGIYEKDGEGVILVALQQGAAAKRGPLGVVGDDDEICGLQSFARRIDGGRTACRGDRRAGVDAFWRAETGR
jgi:hypothetical protein